MKRKLSKSTRVINDIHLMFGTNHIQLSFIFFLMATTPCSTQREILLLGKCDKTRRCWKLEWGRLREFSQQEFIFEHFHCVFLCKEGMSVSPRNCRLAASRAQSERQQMKKIILERQQQKKKTRRRKKFDVNFNSTPVSITCLAGENSGWNEQLLCA